MRVAQQANELPRGIFRETRGVLLLPLLTATFVLPHGYQLGHQDGAIYLPAVKKSLDPALYPHDSTFFPASTLRGFADVWEFGEYNHAGGRVRSQEFPSLTGAERELVLDDAERRRMQQALKLYRSERSNLRRIRGENFRKREVFRPLAGYDYTRPPHPGKLFYQRFQWVPCHPRVDYCRPEEVCRAIRAFGACAGQDNGGETPGASADTRRARGAGGFRDA